MGAGQGGAGRGSLNMGPGEAVSIWGGAGRGETVSIWRRGETVSMWGRCEAVSIQGRGAGWRGWEEGGWGGRGGFYSAGTEGRYEWDRVARYGGGGA